MCTQPYFAELMAKLPSLSTPVELLNHIISPYYPYLLCDHWIGHEIETEGIPLAVSEKDLLRTSDFASVRDYDVIQCQPGYFPFFVNRILPRIEAKIVLITSGKHLPQIHRNQLSDSLLSHPKIALWVSQNPIYTESDRYKAFPYGIAILALNDYRNALLVQDGEKVDAIGHFYLDKTTNRCRDVLPERPVLTRNDFYRSVARSKFVLSPIGDRDDCYRHYEAIGLGTIPIANVADSFRPIFNNSMHYVDSTDAMLTLLEQPDTIVDSYSVPNRDLITTAYHRDRFYEQLGAIRPKLHT